MRFGLEQTQEVRFDKVVSSGHKGIFYMIEMKNLFDLLTKLYFRERCTSRYFQTFQKYQTYSGGKCPAGLPFPLLRNTECCFQHIWRPLFGLPGRVR